MVGNDLRVVVSYLDSVLLAQDGKETRSYSIEALSSQLNQLEQLFAWMNYLGSAGHSASAQIFVDGDGSARPLIKRDGKRLKAKNPPESVSDGVELRISLD